MAANPRMPRQGEVRFYKKIYAAPKYDVLVEIGDCGHNTWRSAAKGDKAQKGIARLVGRNDWNNIFYCGSCTGGGVWRVRW